MYAFYSVNRLLLWCGLLAIFFGARRANRLQGESPEFSFGIKHNCAYLARVFPIKAYNSNTTAIATATTTAAAAAAAIRRRLLQLLLPLLLLLMQVLLLLLPPTPTTPTATVRPDRQAATTLNYHVH